MKPPANSLPCSKGCGCYTERLVEIEPGQRSVALCIFCEDGIPCPAKSSPSLAAGETRSPQLAEAPKKKSAHKSGNGKNTAVRSAAAGELTEETASLKPGSEVIAMAREKQECAADGCDVMTASKVGFCGKHFYMSKLVGAKTKKKTAAEPKSSTPLREGRANGDGRVQVQLSAEAIENYLGGLDWVMLVRQASPERKARLFEMAMGEH